ncbi:unnamed protein product [Blepharisma stoltei]|uniref:Chloride channel protein n=1 Tax=Blepharisma stoltei TaxID=1481888 RepID=A0AAU9JCJ1_9CILI|nr:unnamed protein product [Blepharisma stoltei]
MQEDTIKLLKIFRMEDESPHSTNEMKNIEVSGRNINFASQPPNQSRSKYILTDFFTSIDQIKNPTFEENLTALSKIHRFLTGFSILNPSVWIVLMILGLLSSVIAFCVDYLSEKLMDTREFFASTESGFWNFCIWMLYTLALSWLAAATTKWISPDAEGSGIPEMKAIIAGVKLPHCLSTQTFIAKFTGLIAGSAAGLSIGREGPFVHVAGIIAHKLTKYRIFRHLRTNLTLRNQIMGASVAAGVAAAFGAPVGGVLFSIEVTATYYYVSNLWKGIFCAVWCVIGFDLFRSGEVTDLINLTKLDPIEFGYEIFGFTLLGTLCGFVGAFFIKFTGKMIYNRKNLKYPAIHTRFRYTLFVGAICGILTYMLPYMQLHDKIVINQMFRADNLTTYEKTYWSKPTLSLNLFIYVITKLLLTSLSISCQIPCGVFVPIFAAGSTFGRLFGQILDSIFGTEYRGVYAVVGAAALTSSVTHTLSIAIIVFELTGQIHYFLPMMVGVLLAYSISSGFGISYYDSLLEMKGLPYLPSIKSSWLYANCAKDAVDPQYPFITHEATIKDLAKAIQQSKSAIVKIPVVDDDMNLMFDVNLTNIKRYIMMVYQERLHTLSRDSRSHIEKYFSYLLHEIDDIEYEQSIACRDDSEMKEVDSFLSTPVEFSSDILQLDDSPLSIPENTPLVKVHFLFMMLGLTQIYVAYRGKLMGVVSKEMFLKHR